MRSILFLMVVLNCLFLKSASAEPWLGNRYAGNCAGCHAPGRKNLVAIDRRCTLSCQGCHVNPNGGGMRSFYGRWNQERWLRSFRTPLEKSASSFAPIGRQEYGRVPYGEGKKKDDREAILYGHNLVEVDEVKVNESSYDRSDHLEKVVSKNMGEFLYQVPSADPYRQFDESRVDGGIDARWMWRQLQSESNGNIDAEDSATKWQSFLMSIDPAVRVRPFHRNLHFVYEGRMFGSPSSNAKMSDTISNAGTRSLYAMVDNLPFNVFVMGGYYKPLIGTPSADHNTLSQQMLAYVLSGNKRAQSLLFDAVTIGTAPNVPFANFHIIRGRKTIGGTVDGDQTKGFAGNLGLRFVTLGLAINSTYWRTTDDNTTTGQTTQTEVVSAGISANFFNRLITGLEFLSLTRDADLTDYRRGGVISWENKFRMWREYYLTVDVAHANRTLALLPGIADQFKFGFKMFHLSGLESTLTYDYDVETDEGEKKTLANTHKTSYLTGQFHVFF